MSENPKHWGNRYIYLERIGKGSYGTIYKVKDVKGPEGQGCIKVLKEVSVDSMDKDEIDECAREGKLLSKLKHPNIVQFSDSFCFQGNYCIITEFCEGGDLNKVIVETKQKGGHLEEQRIIRWLIQMVQGLDYIHKRKILHRDVKPRNIFLKSDSVKIGDFGISRILNFTMDLASTFLGTPYYMSPEVLKHDGYNTTSDIWSIGVILYEMCALEHAFNGESLMDVMVKILESPCPKIPSHYSENLQDLIEIILIKDPSKRPSAREILEFPFIILKIRDPWIDIADSLDLSETLVQKETKDISSYMSGPADFKTISDDAVALTPKQKLQLKKKMEADKKAEKQKEYIQKTYKNNFEITKQKRINQFQESMPFTNRRSETSRSSISEYDDLDSSRNSGSKTVVLSKNIEKGKYDQLSKSAKFHNHFKQPISDYQSKSYNNYGNNYQEKEETTIRNHNYNQNGLYNAQYSDLIFDDSSYCNITAYDAVVDSLNQENEVEYSSDFDSDSSCNLNSPHGQNDEDEFQIDTVERFQDNFETDPYGANIKQKKINTMKKKCLEKINDRTLEEALIYLKKNYNKKGYVSGLRKICKSDEIAMTVDQLYFLSSPMNKIY